MTTSGFLLQLEVVQNGAVVDSFELSDAKVKVGKLASSQVHLDDPNVSRIHAVIESQGDGTYQVIDLGSASGTFVNGRKVAKEIVSQGDELRFGDTTVRINVVDLAQQQAAQAQAAQVTQQPQAYAADAPIPEGYIRLDDGTVVEPYTLEGYYDDAGNYIPGYYAEDGAYHYGYGYYDDEGAWQVAHGFYDPDGEWVPTETPEGERISDTEVYTENFFHGETGKILEVAHLWNDAVLDVQSLTTARSIFVGGDEKADYVVEDPALSGPRFPMVAFDEHSGYRINFTPQMGGMIHKDGEDIPLDEMISRGLATQSMDASGAYSFSLVRGMSARLDFGSNTFLVHFAPVPALAGGKYGVEREPFIYLGISLGLHILFMLLVFMLPDGYGGLELFDHSAHDRFAELAMPPEEEEEEEEEEDWLDEAMDEAEAPDPEEVTEDVEEPTVEGDDDMETEDMQVARDMAIVRDAGALAAFQGEIQEAIGGDALTALASLDTDVQGRGVGGLGLEGAGRGGAEGAEGQGRAMVGGGTGGSGVRGANADLGEARQVEPTVIPGNPTSTGGLDREIIQRIVRQHRREITHCYQQELQRNPDLAGRITMQWVITPSGNVATASVQETTMNNRQVEQCMAQRIQRWVFPEPEGGGVVRVNYPFNFST